MRKGLVALATVLALGLPAAHATTIDFVTLADSAAAAGDNFGYAVAISGTRIVVGAPGKDDGAGAVFIYQRLDAGGWTGIKVTAIDRQPGDKFGYSVAIDGDLVVVGALFGDGAAVDSGAAYVLTPAENGFWNQTKLTATDGRAEDFFGVSVAVSGTRILVGADQEDTLGSEAGAAYLYELDDGVWVETKLLASDGASNDLFGRSVAIDGGRAAIGAIYDDGAASDQGAVYVYDVAGGSWTESKLQLGDGARLDLFGDAVAVSGTRVVVGAPLRGNGAAFVFEETGGGWHQTDLGASDGTPEDQFGASVSIDGDTIAVGAPLDGGIGQNAGAVYRFELADAHWFETKLVDPIGAIGDTAGASVDVDGEMVAVGVPLHDSADVDAGRTFVIEPADIGTPPPINLDEPAPTSSPVFGDVAGTTFEAEILWMAGAGITDGCGDGNFCPKEPVTRAQMAVFLTRALGLELGAPNPFTDVGGAHAEAAAAIAAAGISLGCGDGTTFCPYDAVTRAQMGSFFARALGLELLSTNRFDDVRGTHAAAVNAIAAEGITLGCNPDGTLFCPNEPITRGQMAAFLYRAFGG